MSKATSLLLFLILLFFLFNCNQTKESKIHYKEQIGNTPFDAEKDDPDFKFCDSSNVLHKRAFVRYKGGLKGLYKDIYGRYNYTKQFESFNGYLVIRFAVNCKNEAGRFRIQALDTNFHKSNSPIELENHVLKVFKGLKDWEHAVYRGKDYDGYKFLTLKIINGQIIQL